MILQIEQDLINSKSVYRIFNRKGTYGEVIIPNQPIILEAQVKLPYKDYSVEVNPAKYGKLYGISGSMGFYIVEDGSVVGKVYRDCKLIKKFLGSQVEYYYYIVEAGDKKYFAYGYNDRTEGFFLSIYLNDELIGALEVMEGFHNGTKPYKIYTEDEAIIHVFAFLMLFIDRTICGNFHSGGYENNSELFRYCDKLKEKYNFEYIERLREKEETVV